MANVVLIESYYGGSHRSWADSWRTHSRHDVSFITHPDEFWRWRLRGGAVTLAEAFDAHVAEHGRPDAVVVSGLVDVASFAGLCRRPLGPVPMAVYMHESQLLYPLAPNQRRDNDAALTNWRSTVAADAVWFNSAFHRDALRSALPDLLRAQPDPSHSHLIDDVFARSTVLWPGVQADELIASARTERRVPRVLWNQRWDHDKNPRAVFAALAKLADDGIEFTLALAGERSHADNDEFGDLLDRLESRIDHEGFVPADGYHQLLLESDVVVSAADHEFFGIAIVEALAAAALPVLPTRLSFPELIEPQWHGEALYPDGQLRHRLGHVLTNIAETRERLAGVRESMTRFDVARAAENHDQAVDALLHGPS
jgi:glycosyltransferase involved in cell wall biosynthesis